ncbi:hypothetical protein ACSBR2_041815 [Camellia fascicularis]
MNEEPSNQRVLPTDIPAEKQSCAAQAHPSSAYVVSPVWRVSPKNNGSTLFDSFELQAVTKKLNRALQGPNSNHPLSPYSYYLRSPLYRQRLGNIYRENAKTPKRIASRRVDRARVDGKAGGKDTGGGRGHFVIRLWKKVKRGFLWNKQ